MQAPQLLRTRSELNPKIQDASVRIKCLGNHYEAPCPGRILFEVSPPTSAFSLSRFSKKCYTIKMRAFINGQGVNEQQIIDVVNPSRKTSAEIDWSFESDNMRGKFEAKYGETLIFAIIFDKIGSIEWEGDIQDEDGNSYPLAAYFQPNWPKTVSLLNKDLSKLIDKYQPIQDKADALNEKVEKLSGQLNQIKSTNNEINSEMLPKILDEIQESRESLKESQLRWKNERESRDKIFHEELKQRKKDAYLKHQENGKHLQMKMIKEAKRKAEDIITKEEEDQCQELENQKLKYEALIAKYKKEQEAVKKAANLRKTKLKEEIESLAERYAKLEDELKKQVEETKEAEIQRIERLLASGKEKAKQNLRVIANTSLEINIRKMQERMTLICKKIEVAEDQLYVLQNYR